MDNLLSFLVIAGVLLLIPVIWWVATGNRFVVLASTLEESWSDIDVQLKRRHDLIPNLVSTVKGYAAHEKDLLERLVQLREAATSGTAKKHVGEENEISRTISQLMVRLEAYPDLKASTNFLELQRELADTEDRIAAARRFYNANVKSYNTAVQMFPSSLIAQSRSLYPEEYFELSDFKERENVQVSF